MKTTPIPAILLVFLLIGYAAFLVLSEPLLPEHMASHFGAGGQPNGWMERASAVMLMGGIGVILPLFIAAIFFLLRFLPTQMINMPHREFWLGPEHRAETLTYLFRQGLWLANLHVGLLGLVWYWVIEANRAGHTHLSEPGIWSALGVFVVAMMVWLIRFVRHFGKPV